MCKGGLKGQWNTQPRASEAAPWVYACWSSRALKGQKHYNVLWTFTGNNFLNNTAVRQSANNKAEC